jgi:hypothetical protein
MTIAVEKDIPNEVRKRKRESPAGEDPLFSVEP